MEPSRKHNVNGIPSPPRTTASATPRGGPADGVPLRQVAVEARRATARALEGEFNPRSMLPPFRSRRTAARSKWIEPSDM
jgi:hypothetical protein